MRTFKTIVCSLIVVFTLSIMVDVYAKDSVPTVTPLGACMSIGKIMQNKKISRPDKSDMKTAVMTGMCESIAKQFTSRYGNTIVKTISEGYGNDIETSYSLESFCYNANLFLDALPDIWPLLYVLAEPYAVSIGEKVTPAALLGAFEGMRGTEFLVEGSKDNSSMIRVDIFMTNPMVNKEYGQTRAYKELFGALYRGNYKKALEVVDAYAQREDVKEVIKKTRMFCSMVYGIK